MKRMLALFMAVLAIGFVGCNSGSEAQNNATTAIETTTIETTPGEATDVAGLYSLAADWKTKNPALSVKYSDGYLIMPFVVGGMDTVEMTVVVYSVADEMTTAEIEVDCGQPQCGALSKGDFYIFDCEKFEMTYYSCIGEKKEKMTLPAVKDCSYMELLGTSTDGTKIVYSEYSTTLPNQLAMYDTVTKEETVLSEDIFYYISSDNEKMQLQGTDNNIFTLTFADKKLERIGDTLYYVTWTPYYGVDEKTNQFVLCSCDDLTNGYAIKKANDQETFITAGKNIFISSENYYTESNTFKYTDLANKCKYSVEIPKLHILGGCLTDEGQAIMVAGDGEGKDWGLYLFDPTKAEKSEKIDVETVSLVPEVPEWKGSEETIRLAQELLDKYSVRAIWSNDKSKDLFESVDTISMSKCSEEYVTATLKYLTEHLDYYPDGMLKEIGNQREIWLYLGKDLSVDNGLTSDAAGVYIMSENHVKIGIDIDGMENGNVGVTLAHELSHAIDDRVDYKWISGWVDLLPEDIREKAYFNDYSDYTDLSYTAYSDNNSPIWFSDSYGRTYPTEDRACIFQGLYESYEAGAIDFRIDYDNLKLKARYYCVMLRDNFDSCKNAKNLPWEQYLGEINMDEFKSVVGE